MEPTVERTEAFTLMVVPPVAARPLRRSGAARVFQLAFLSSFLLVALVGTLIYLGVFLGNAPAAPQATAAPVQSAPVPSQTAAAASVSADPALHLFETIGPAMSLYDLDQAAGGTGRIIRASDPHILLIFYEYPHHSVHVALSRTNLAGEDYQVKAVALYRGKTLLQRHSEME